MIESISKVACISQVHISDLIHLILYHHIPHLYYLKLLFCKTRTVSKHILLLFLSILQYQMSSNRKIKTSTWVNLNLKLLEMSVIIFDAAPNMLVCVVCVSLQSSGALIADYFK